MDLCRNVVRHLEYDLALSLDWLWWLKMHTRTTCLQLRRPSGLLSKLFVLKSSSEHECLWKFTSFYSCQYIWLKKRKIHPHGGAQGKVRGSPKSSRLIIWGPWMSAQHCITVHSIVGRSCLCLFQLSHYYYLIHIWMCLSLRCRLHWQTPRRAPTPP